MNLWRNMLLTVFLLTGMTGLAIDSIPVVVVGFLLAGAVLRNAFHRDYPDGLDQFLIDPEELFSMFPRKEKSND